MSTSDHARHEIVAPLPRVLVVDDEAANLKTFGRVFRRELDLRFAASGEAALEALRTEHVRVPFDVLLTDYAMPHMNGLELLRCVRAEWPGVARVLVTAHRFLQGDLEGTGLVAAVVLKPWDKGDLLRLIGRLVGGDVRPRSRSSVSALRRSGTR